MLKFAFSHMRVRLAKLVMVSLSIVISASVAMLAYNISTQVSDGIIQTAANFDMIIGPEGSSTQLAMNTMFFTEKPLGTIPYSVVEELEQSGMTNLVVPFSMGDSYNDAPIVGTTPAFLDGKTLKLGVMFEASYEAVIGYDVAKQYGLAIGDSIVTSHGLGSVGAEHAETPLTVTGILSQTHTAYDTAVFTGCETIWALHGHDDEAHDGAVATYDEDSDHANDGQTICAVLVRSKSVADYSRLTEIWTEKTDYLVINPNTVLREVLENVDMSRTIVYILCGVILVMNLFVISLIAMLNAHDARAEISLMRLIGISMKNINILYLIENSISGGMALGLSLLAAHLCLQGVRSFVASMGIVLNAAHVYPMEWAVLGLVFLISLTPTTLMTVHMSRQDSIDR